MNLSPIEYNVLFDRTERQSFFLTIAIPTFNRFDLLVETLHSVFSQCFDFDVEILVVDNDPNNEELAVAAMAEFKEKPFKYIKNTENIGMFGNWNQCLYVAKGKFITLLHDDDILLPSFSMEMNSFFVSSNRCSSLSFNTMVWDQRISSQSWDELIAIDASVTKSAGKKIKNCISSLFPLYEISITELFFNNRFHGTLGVVIEREKALAIGGFDSEWYPIADYEFWSRWVLTYGYIPRVRVLVGLYRVRNNESIREEVQNGFIVQSKKLRQKMIAENLVPEWISTIVDDLSLLQSIDIASFWRSNVERLNYTGRNSFFQSKLRVTVAKVRVKIEYACLAKRD